MDKTKYQKAIEILTNKKACYVSEEDWIEAENSRANIQEYVKELESRFSKLWFEKNKKV